MRSDDTTRDRVLDVVRELAELPENVRRGAPWEVVVADARLTNFGPVRVEEAIFDLMDMGVLNEPILGRLVVEAPT